MSFKAKHEGRILAVQALYAYDVGSISLDEILKLEWNSSENELSMLDQIKLEKNKKEIPEASISAEEQESNTYARILISGTVNQLETIDELLKKHISETWTFERINKVALAILRMSIFSLLNEKDLGSKIVISEALDIYSAFSDDDKYKFINAVLDKISKEITA